MAPNDEPGYTDPMVCTHCRNHAPFTILAQHEDQSSWEWDNGRGPMYAQYAHASRLYRICRCPACGGVLLTTYYWTSWMDDDDIESKVLYPVPIEAPSGLPTSVKRAYDEALAVKTASANSYAVMLGRVLDIVCVDRGATGRDLYRKLTDLASKGEIPGRLSEIAQRLRELRNFGAHADLGDLPPEAIPVLDNLTRSLLEYVYSAPSYLETAEEQLNELRKQRKIE